MDSTERQRDRERSARDAALGRRVQTIKNGGVGPVLKRWINADVAPVANLMRKVAVAYLEGDTREVATLLDTPTADISGRERPLSALLEWCLRGKSPGRLTDGDESTYAEDLSLTFLAAVVLRLARQDKDYTIAYALSIAADALREAVLGQFITSIQGASAMQAVRERQPEIWQQKKSLARICSKLNSQVRPQLEQEEAGERELRTVGHRKVLTVLDHKGDERMLSLVPPDAVAWEVMSLCWIPEGDTQTPEHKSIWLAFAGMFLAAAQRCSGWFDITEKRQRHGKHIRHSKLLVLSEEAVLRIGRDVEAWVGAGFHAEPMLVPPIDGDYLTVKHRKVTGQRAPKGMTTDPKETTPWMTGACVLAETPWTVNPYALSTSTFPEAIPSSETLPSSLGSPSDVLKLAEHRRLAAEPAMYLPVTMDFRGRIYYRPAWVSPQSGDLGKSLLCFPLEGAPYEGKAMDERQEADWWEALAMHLAGLYAGPDKLDKAPLPARAVWLDAILGLVDLDKQGDPHAQDMLDEVIAQADKPLTLKANLMLMFRGETDRIPIQLDGTCNGLQHLSALLRDEEGAKHVNLVASSLEEPPADIYGVVAGLAVAKINEVVLGVPPMYVPGEIPAWMIRFGQVHLMIDRKITKGPVMVLPYGGTREAVRRSVKEAVLDRLPPEALSEVGPWRAFTGDNYGAFKGRELRDHPLFNADIGSLSSLIWDCIAPVIPRAMGAMGTLQAIGSWVGDRGLSWRVGTGDPGARLWVTQAKSLAARKQVTMRGYALPDMVRRLTLNAHSNEVDPRAHKTGIVANFIHSQDAAHLVAAVALFRMRGGGCVGSVHDCVMVRPSEAALMNRCLRDAFVDLYTVPGRMCGWDRWGEGPLSQPVRLWRDKDTLDCEFPSWHHLAAAAGTSFPERGTFDITEVRQSAWFFS